MKRRLFILAGMIGALSALTRQTLLAQAYPSHALKLLVPFTAGGSIDMAARAIAVKLTQSLGQPVLIEDRPGANRAIAALVLSARCD